MSFHVTSYSESGSLSPPKTAKNAASSKSISFGIATAISWYQIEALENVSKKRISFFKKRRFGEFDGKV